MTCHSKSLTHAGPNIYTQFSQCLTKPHSKAFSICPTILSKHYLSWTVLWKQIEKTRKAFISSKNHQRRDLEVQRFVKPRLKLDFVEIFGPLSFTVRCTYNDHRDEAMCQVVPQGWLGSYKTVPTERDRRSSREVVISYWFHSWVLTGNIFSALGWSSRIGDGRFQEVVTYRSSSVSNCRWKANKREWDIQRLKMNAWAKRCFVLSICIPKLYKVRCVRWNIDKQ